MSKQDLLEVADDFPFLVSETLMLKLPRGMNAGSRFGNWGTVLKLFFFTDLYYNSGQKVSTFVSHPLLKKI